MYIKALCAFILVFCLAISGCVSSRYSDMGTREELLKYKAEIYQLNEQVTSLNKELEALRKEMHEIKQTEETKKGESRIKETTLISHASPIQEKQSIAKEKTTQSSVPEPEKKKQIQEPERAKKEVLKKMTSEKLAVQGKEVDIKALKVKVLGGNGKLSTARDMSKKLEGMGYKVEDVGISPRTDFKANTIYYAAKYQKEAEHLAARLGNKTMSKPLSWSSVFHIIVVAAP
ncbi:MAG: LytR C-terminal domain-containing protein [Syntrophaceae bacterium]